MFCLRFVNKITFPCFGCHDNPESKYIARIYGFLLPSFFKNFRLINSKKSGLIFTSPNRTRNRGEEKVGQALTKPMLGLGSFPIGAWLSFDQTKS